MRLVIPLLVLFFTVSLSAAEKPNIVLIMSDDMGYSDIGCYGGEIETPRLNELAKTGVRFTQFYNTGRCCPTRASLLTGLYPHQAGVGHMMSDYGLPAYRGDLNRNCLTIAEALKPAGYRTYMAGKWHVTPNNAKQVDNPNKSNWPLQRGFDRFFGTIHGAGSFFDPNSLTRDNEFISPQNDPEYQPEGTWYYTNAIADNTARYIDDHFRDHSREPFFAYVAFTAAHWPMHALPEDIAQYEGEYDGGYTPTRDARVKRLKELGLLPDNWTVTEQVGDWSQVENKEWESACMEVYAAMIHCLDGAIGRIVDSLDRNGQLDNTLIFFLQDNGGCAETFGRGERVGPLERPDKPTLPPMAKDELQTEMIPPQSRDGYPLRRGEGVMPGFPETEIGYGRNWANVSNTPFREYKHYVHEGGVSTPLIVHWPAGISGEGDAFRQTDEGPLYDTPSHLIDIMATALDVAGASYPKMNGDNKITPFEGTSLRNAFGGKELERGKPIYFEHEGNRAVRDGKWKLVAKGTNSPWELYDMEADRTETDDLAGTHPEKLAVMAKQYDDWAAERGIVPFDSLKKGSDKKMEKKKNFQLGSGDSLDETSSPFIANKPFRITAEVSGLPAEGVIVSQGGSNHGWALYIEKGDLVFASRNKGQLRTVGTTLPEGKESLQLEANIETQGVGMFANGEMLTRQKALPMVLHQPQEGLQVGSDPAGRVGEYGESNQFTGTVKSVEIKIGK